MSLRDLADRDPDLVPFAVGVLDDDRLALRALGGDHPLDDLLGFTAPDDWWAVGLVVAGTARPFDGPDDEAGSPVSDGPLGAVHREGQARIRMVHLQPRRGPSFGLADLTTGDGPVELPEGQGRAADACLRVIGRRTPTPQSDARVLVEVVWLDRILRLVLEEGCTRPDATTLARLHPLAPGPPTLATGGLADLAVLGDAVGWSARWRTWRSSLASGRSPVLGIAPETAEWMDDGMFARWLVGELPPLGALVDDLATLVPRAVLLDLIDTARTVRTRAAARRPTRARSSDHPE